MKTNLDKLYKTNEDYEKNGVWMDISEDTAFLVRPMKGTNPRVKAAMAAYYKPYARQIEMDTLDPKKAREIQVKIFVDVCLVDWKGIEIDGVDTKFSKEAAIKLFVELPDLFDTLQKYANDFTNYKDDLGNS